MEIQIGEIEDVKASVVMSGRPKGIMDELKNKVKPVIDKLEKNQSFVITIGETKVSTLKNSINNAIEEIRLENKLAKGVITYKMVVNSKDKDGKVISIRVGRIS